MTRRASTLVIALLALASLGFEWEGRLSRLRRELTTPDPARRREVVALLANYAAAEVREPLLSALEDSDAGVRAEAAEAVGRVRLREAVPRLLDWLDDPEADVRAAAARALGQVGESNAVPNLVRVLGDTNADVRRAGVAALASIGGDEVVVPLLGRLDDADARVRVDAATVLGRLRDPRAVVPLVGRARDDTPEVRTAVYAALGDLGDPRASAALVQGLRDDAPEPRLAAIAALGRLGSGDAVRPLVSLSTSPDPRVPRAITAALGQIRSPRALEALVEGLATPATRVMAQETLIERVRRESRAGREDEARHATEALARALEEADDPEHVSELARSLEDLAAIGDVAGATQALLRALREGRGEPPPLLRALGATGSPDALVPLLERLRTDEVPQRLAVLEGLRRYFDRAPPDGRAADPLLSILGEVGAAEREPVVELLGRVRAARALPTLRTLLGHADASLRSAAIRAIGAIGDPDGAPALLPLLDDLDGRLRYEAARAIGAAASPAVLRALLDRALTREPTDRHAVLAAITVALVRLAERRSLPEPLARRSQDVLHRFADGPDEALAARALDAIAAWRPEGAAPTLIELLGRAGPRRSSSVIHALGALDDDRARATLRELLSGPSVSLATQAASVLGEHGTTEDADRLLALAPRLAWPASAAAAFALARLARRGVLDPRAQPGLCAIARSHDPFVRANVAAAMAALGSPPCPDGAHPLRWLEPRRAAIVRAAAARWARAAADAERLPATEVEAALASCAAEPLSPELAAVCARPAMPALTGAADVYAYAPDGETLLASRLVALRLADSTIWITHTDANGHLRLRDAPEGSIRLEDPAATPLEP